MIRLKIETPGQAAYEHVLEGDSAVVGRSATSDLPLADRYLSRQHAKLLLRDGELLVEDLGSRNGTVVNGSRITGPTPVKAGDQIRLSSSTISILEEETVTDGLSDTVLPDTTLFVSSSDLQASFLSGDSDTARGVAGLRRQAERLALLNDVHRAVASSIDLDQLLELVLERAFDHLQPEEGAIFLRDNDGEYSRVASRKAESSGDDYLYSRTLVRQVSEQGVAALVLDAQTDERFAGAASIISSGVRSLMAAPLSYAEGSLGMIAVSSHLHTRQFTENDLELLSSLASVAALRIWTLRLAQDAAERKRLEAELEFARKTQLALLPECLPVLSGYQIHASNTPSRGVSGDFYQVVSRSGGDECVFLVADVSGKGMGASLSAATLEALAAVPILDGLPPDEICGRLNALLEQRTAIESYATAFLAVLEPSSGAVSYASAGHNPGILVRSAGDTESLGRTGFPLGLLPEADYTTKRCQLDPGDTLVVYSDGITEATNPGDEEYGVERLTNVCLENHAAGVETLASMIDTDLREFVQGEADADDRTLVLVHRCAEAEAKAAIQSEQPTASP